MNDSQHLSPAVEDYLKAIYEKMLDQPSTSTSQIAELLSVSPASVTSMLKKMAAMQPPLLQYQKHHGVRLTEDGRRATLGVIRRHRLLEQFLVKILGYTWDEVHSEAERLEHAISALFVKRMAQVLGEPLFDPHGDPIPGPNLSLPKQDCIPLVDLAVGQKAVVRQVRRSDPGMLKRLAEMGVRPGIVLVLLECTPYDRIQRLRLVETGEERLLAPALGGRIWVEVQKPEEIPA